MGWRHTTAAAAAAADDDDNDDYGMRVWYHNISK